MVRIEKFGRRWACAAALGVLVALSPSGVRAQDEGAPPIIDSTEVYQQEKYENLYSGQFTPGSGFDIIRTTRGTLNISFYGLFRWVDQTPAQQPFTDHLGRPQVAKARNDINWHRSMIWLTGWFYDPKFRYNMTAWSLASTEQNLIFGNLRYLLSEKITFGVGVSPNLTNRSLQGSWPFWAASDRQMAEEFLRGGFASGAFITGMPLPRFYYTAAVDRSISQLGNTVGDDNRDMAYSASLWWRPTTGEFGPRGGFGDLEQHNRVATQFGVSGCTTREGRYVATSNPTSKAAQIRISDGLNPFDLGALADGVTVTKLTYQNMSFDAGAKYKGFSFQGEFSYRILSNFEATGPVPVDHIHDRGFFAEAMHMVVPGKLGIYGVGSYVYDAFRRYPWELGGGASLYPYANRNWRINLHVIHVDRSPTGSNFGYYSAGMTGTIISMGTDILL